MTRGFQSGLLAVTLGAALAAPGGALAASPAEDDDVLPIAIQVPFGFLVMHVPPFPSGFPDPGAWDVQLGITTTNNFVFSQEIGLALGARTSRQPFTAADFSAVAAANPGRDLYYFDGEVTELALTVSGSPAPGFTVGGQVPLVHFGGGFLDPTIEAFHDVLHLTQDYRGAVTQNERALGVLIGGREEFVSGNEDTGVADPVLFMRWGPHRDPRAWSFAMEAGVKVAIASTSRLLSTGAPDFGAAVAVGKRGRAWTFAFQGGFVLPGNGAFLDGLPLTPVASAAASAGYRFRTTSLWLQAVWEQSPLRNKTSAPLGNDEKDLTLGVRFPLAGSARGYAALTENVIEFDNSSDIAIHFGVCWTLGR